MVTCATTDTNSVSSNSGHIRASKIDTSSLPATFKVYSLIAHVSSTGTGKQFAMGLYNDTAGVPSSLIVATSATTPTGTGANTISVSTGTITNTGTLWLGFQSDDSGATFQLQGRSTGGSSGDMRHISATFPTFPTSFGSSTPDAEPAYVCFDTTPTPSSGGTRLPPPPLIARF